MKINFPRILARLIDLFLRYFRIVVVIVTVVLVVFGYSLFIQPKWDEVKQTGIFDYNNENQLKEKNEKYLSDLKVSLAEFNKIKKDDLEKLSKIIPSDQGLADLFVVVEDLVKKSGLILNSITFAEGPSLNESLEKTTTEEESTAAASDLTAAISKNIYILDIALSISGGREYQDLKVLLDNIEKEQRIMDVGSITFNPNTQGSVTQEMSFGLNLKTYYFNEE